MGDTRCDPYTAGTFGRSGFGGSTGASDGNVFNKSPPIPRNPTPSYPEP